MHDLPLPSPAILPGTSAYRRVSIALFLAGYATFSLLYCVQPLLPIFAQNFRIGPAVSSLALSVSTLCLAASILAAAALAESVDRRHLMFGALAGACLLNIAAGFAPGWPMLLTLRALEGFALGGVPAVGMAYLAEQIDPRGLGAAMGLYIAGNAFGGMSGRVTTGLIAQAAGWRPALVAVGVVGLAAAAGFVLLLPKSGRSVRTRRADLGFHVGAWRGHLRHPGLRRLFAVGFLMMGSFVAVYNYAGFRLVAAPIHLSQGGLGLVFTVYLFGIAASYAAGVLSDRLGRHRVMAGGIVIAGSGVAMTWAPGLAAMIGGLALLTIGFFTAHTVASGWVGRLAAGAKGHAASLYLLAYYAGSSLIGSAGGWVWRTEGWEALVLAMLGLLATAWILGRGIVDRVTEAERFEQAA